MTPTPHAAEALASRLPALIVAAERVAMTVAQGVHGRRRVGQGEAFWQFRRYEQGDAATRIDWRQTAKREHAFVRETEWEASQTIFLWADPSASMRWRSRADLPEKLERAELLALALMGLLTRGGERVALLGDAVATSGRFSLPRFAARLAERRDGAGLPPPARMPRHAQIVLIGDFLSPLAEVDASLRAIADRGIKGVLLHIHDPAEATLPYDGRTRFEGLEHEAAIMVPRVESLRADYQREFAAHRAGLGDIARALGWTMLAHATDKPAEAALLALYMALARR